MDIILIEDIENKGKKNDIISVASGYANYLISHKKAIACTIENLNTWQKEKDKEKENSLKLKEEAIKISNLLNNTSYEVKTEGTPKGSLKNSITKEDVLNLLKEKYPKIKLNKTQLNMNIIKTFGIHKVGIDLGHEVKAIITLDISEA